jgi:hypothetical protein
MKMTNPHLMNNDANSSARQWRSHPGQPLPVPGFAGNAQAQTQGGSANSDGSAFSVQKIARRKLGQLEVSSIGLGVQNMARTYQTTIPARPEMIHIIRTAYERGVTFFDTAEAYGPHECERILGEAIAPFRDKVVITSKFGWNIDLEDRGARVRG